MKFFVHSLEGTGHFNACIGLGQALADRGHEIVFVVNEKIAPTAEKFGFRTIPLIQTKSDKKEVLEFSDNPARDIAETLVKTGVFSPKSPYEKFDSMISADDDNIMVGVAKMMIDFNPQIEKIVAEERPDCWIHDHFIFPPAIGKAKLPWILVASANPLGYIQSEDLPPAGSGCPANDRTDWKKFHDKWTKAGPVFEGFQTNVEKELGFVNENHYIRNKVMIRSPYLTVYQFPKELDYDDMVEIPDYMAQCDAFRRREPQPFKLPQEFLDKPGDKLIYFSMGSMGGFDVEMQQRIVDMLGRMPHKCIISKGPRGDELTLPDNCWGENYLPQPDVIDQVDLVITHGGNNSFTETFASGKPMIVMPLFGDQYDNAQRVEEKGYGIRLEPYTVKEPELVNAVNKLLNDHELHKKLEAVRERVQNEKTKDELCIVIEDMMKKHLKV